MILASNAVRSLCAAAIVWASAAAAAAQSSAPANAPQPPASLRPPADVLIPCEKLPKNAVTRLQPDLAAWATIYCTKYGQLFNANETHFGAFPDNGVRATFNAATMDGKEGDAGAGSYFTSIAYADFTPVELQGLLKVDPIVAKITTGKKLKKLELQTSGGKGILFLVIEPAADPFWVFPLTEKGLGSPAFFVISLEAINRKR